jgi:hypothetical protein
MDNEPLDALTVAEQLAAALTQAGHEYALGGYW